MKGAGSVLGLLCWAARPLPDDVSGGGSLWQAQFVNGSEQEAPWAEETPSDQVEAVLVMATLALAMAASGLIWAGLHRPRHSEPEKEVRPVEPLTAPTGGSMPLRVLLSEFLKGRTVEEHGIPEARLQVSLAAPPRGRCPPPPKATVAGSPLSPPGTPAPAGKASPPTGKAPPRGKGKAPPPPPPRLGGKASPLKNPGCSLSGTDSSCSPQKTASLGSPFGARRVRWRALESVDGTVFEGLKRGPLRDSTAQALREVFEHGAAGAKAASSSRPMVFVPKSSGVCILDRNRAQQLAIFFRRSPVPLEQLCSRLDRLDFNRIPVGDEEVEAWLQAWPTVAERRLITGHTGPSSSLRDVEQLVQQVARVPRSEQRLKLLRLAKGLGTLRASFTNGLAAIRTACSELLTSSRLRLLLSEALSMGNYINHGIAEAGAAGFALDALLQLQVMKGSGGASALHCLCVSCFQEDTQFCAALSGELRSLSAATQVSLASLRELAQRLRDDVAAASVELTAHSAEYSEVLEEELEPRPVVAPAVGGPLASAEAKPSGGGDLSELKATPRLEVTFEGEEEDSQASSKEQDKEGLGSCYGPLMDVPEWEDLQRMISTEGKQTPRGKGLQALADAMSPRREEEPKLSQWRGGGLRQFSPATCSTCSTSSASAWNGTGTAPTSERGLIRGVGRPRLPILKLPTPGASPSCEFYQLLAPRGIPRDRSATGWMSRNNNCSPLNRLAVSPRAGMAPGDIGCVHEFRISSPSPTQRTRCPPSQQLVLPRSLSTL
ncbi:unnamed protein product, partial [Polarella glacialis]